MKKVALSVMVIFVVLFIFSIRSFPKDVPERTETAMTPIKDAGGVVLGFDDVDGWRAMPDWLGNPARNYELKVDDGVGCFEVVDKGRGMKWLRKLEDGPDLSAMRYLTVRYRTMNTAKPVDYSIWLASAPGKNGGKPDGTIGVFLPLGDDDGAWRVHTMELRGKFRVAQIAVQVQAERDGAKMWLDYVRFSSKRPRFSSEETGFAYPCCFLEQAPALDGRVGMDPAWKNVPETIGFLEADGRFPRRRLTFLRIGRTDDALHIAVKCLEPNMDAVKPVFRDMGALWREDSMEIVVFPNGARHPFQFIVSAIGSRFNGRGPGGPRMPLGDWVAKTHRGKDHWSVELKIPFSIFGLVPEEGEVWGCNAARNSFAGGRCHRTNLFGRTHIFDSSSCMKIVFKKTLPTSAECARAESNDPALNMVKGRIVRLMKLFQCWKKGFQSSSIRDASERNRFASTLKSVESLKKRVTAMDGLPWNEVVRLLRETEALLEEIDELRLRKFR